MHIFNTNSIMFFVLLRETTEWQWTRIWLASILSDNGAQQKNHMEVFFMLWHWLRMKFDCHHVHAIGANSQDL